MIKLLSQFTLVTIKFYQEKSQQIIEYVRENPTQTQSMFETIKIDIHNINKVLEGLDDKMEIFDYSDTADLFVYVQKLKSTVETMEIFLADLEAIIASREIEDGQELDFSKYDVNIEESDGEAA